ncbi:hypothetical protein [Roseobacter sinensis]|uniref:Uncharacterized protein n=1 Tax=Roseobacter sinensis TaxID=2931391 RepID=A0ABT3BFY6_9RHOB|nr:hypothetical protein [Roseobacter sp. WL0113]MCV3272478.1 hypothetical protein [Roseobacter sp. WL0113]
MGFDLGLPSVVLVFIMAAVFATPIWMLLPKFGMSKWWAIPAVNPAFVFIFCWIFAFRDPVQTTEERA